MNALAHCRALIQFLFFFYYLKSTRQSLYTGEGKKISEILLKLTAYESYIRR